MADPSWPPQPGIAHQHQQPGTRGWVLNNVCAGPASLASVASPAAAVSAIGRYLGWRGPASHRHGDVAQRRPAHHRQPGTAQPRLVSFIVSLSPAPSLASRPPISVAAGPGHHWARCWPLLLSGFVLTGERTPSVDCRAARTRHGRAPVLSAPLSSAQLRLR